MRPMLARLFLGATLALTVLVLCVALTVTGILWLLGAMELMLEPWIGAAAARAAAGLIALLPLLLLILKLRLALVRRQQPAGSGPLRELVRENPWESASFAFLLGMSWREDPVARAALLRHGPELMRSHNRTPREDTPSD